MKKVLGVLIAFFFSVTVCSANSADNKAAVYPAAIFNFIEKGNNLSGLGEKISTVIFSQLVTDPSITLVDREELSKMEDEAVLNLSGMVNPQQANQIGQLTGAKIIVTGSVFEIEDHIMIVSKVIGSETSRVLGASVKGGINDSVVPLSEELAKKIAKVISSNVSSLVAKPMNKVDRLSALKKKLKSYDKPTVLVEIKERHINRSAIDPAAETEMILYCLESGFKVIDKALGKPDRADILIVGEGFSELASRKGDLVAVKARLEVKAIDQATNQVLAVDRQTELEVDLSEMTSAKKALEKASAKIAERLLPKIVSH